MMRGMWPRRRAHHAARSRAPFAGVIVVLVLTLAGVLGWRMGLFERGAGRAPGPGPLAEPVGRALARALPGPRALPITEPRAIPAPDQRRVRGPDDVPR